MKLEEEISQKAFRNNKHKAIVNIIFSYNWLLTNHFKLLKPYDLTIQQFNILRILRGQYPNPATVKLLKERMLDKMSDASRLVEKLRSKGLVDRKVSDKSRRNVDVLITQKGLDLLAEIDKKNSEFDQLIENLDTRETEQLNNLLDKLRG
ncbi:MAG: transcriptional regulator [Ignavibacteria bacterium GWA2_35_9]|nr:MAG: transcriptional regulator [Ignavibacteria bacterium GWA2_35_9]OGU52298.1 MAG: transcriptional regulator [Ignavibacteria bacterium GWC2_36_12]